MKWCNYRNYDITVITVIARVKNARRNTDMSKVTYEDVSRATRRLLECGEIPSAPKIRKLIGNRGGMATIQKHLDAWRKSEEGKRAEISPLPEMPQQLAIDATLLIQQIWGKAKAESDREITFQREKLAEDRVEIEGKLAEAIAVSEIQEQQINELKEQVDHMNLNCKRNNVY